MINFNDGSYKVKHNSTGLGAYSGEIERKIKDLTNFTQIEVCLNKLVERGILEPEKAEELKKQFEMENIKSMSEKQISENRKDDITIDEGRE